MTQKTKKCSKCHKVKPLDEFYNSKDSKYGKRAICKKCFGKQSKKYTQEHPEEYREYALKYYYKNREDSLVRMKRYSEGHKEERRQKGNYKSMYENKLCAQYLGIVIGECLCRHLFKDVQVMPRGNTGYDIICNKGKKIDVKTACITLADSKYPHWQFHINNNTIPDYFIFVAFDNRTDLNPLHIWMIPGKEINSNSSKSISPSTIHKWGQWEINVNDAQICCAELKESNYEI